MKEHKKLYKSGKLWMTATVMALAAGTAIATTTAHADANPTNPGINGTQNTDQQKAALQQDIQNKQQLVTDKQGQVNQVQQNITDLNNQISNENQNYQKQLANPNQLPADIQAKQDELNNLISANVAKQAAADKPWLDQDLKEDHELVNQEQAKATSAVNQNAAANERIKEVERVKNLHDPRTPQTINGHLVNDNNVDVNKSLLENAARNKLWNNAYTTDQAKNWNGNIVPNNMFVTPDNDKTNESGALDPNSNSGLVATGVSQPDLKAQESALWSEVDKINGQPTMDQYRELSILLMNIINNARKARGLAPFVMTEKMFQAEMTASQTTTSWDHATIDPIVESNLGHSVYGSCITGAYVADGPKTLYGYLYGIMKSMNSWINEDDDSNWGHRNIFLDPASGWTAAFGFSKIDNNGGLSINFNIAALGDDVNSSSNLMNTINNYEQEGPTVNNSNYAVKYDEEISQLKDTITKNNKFLAGHDTRLAEYQKQLNNDLDKLNHPEKYYSMNKNYSTPDEWNRYLDLDAAVKWYKENHAAADLTALKADHEKKITDLNSQVKAQQTNLAQLKSDIENLQSQIDQDQQSLQNIQKLADDIKKAQKAVNDQKAAIQQDEQQVSDTQSALNDAQSKADQAATTAQQANDNYAQLTQRWREETQQRKEYQNELKAKQDAFNQTADARNLQSQINDLHNQLVQLVPDFDDFVKALKEADQLSAADHARYNTLNNQYDQLKDQLRNKQATAYGDVQSKLNDLNKIYPKHTMEWVNAGKQLDQANSDKTAADNDLQNAKTNHDNAAKKLHDDQTQLQTLQNQLDQLLAQQSHTEQKDNQKYTDLEPDLVTQVSLTEGAYTVDNLPAPTLSPDAFLDDSNSQAAALFMVLARDHEHLYPAGTTVAWADPAQVIRDAQIPGDHDEYVVLHFPDGTTSASFLKRNALHVSARPDTPTTHTLTVKYVLANGTQVGEQSFSGHNGDTIAADRTQIPTGYDYAGTDTNWNGNLTIGNADNTINVLVVAHHDGTPDHHGTEPAEHTLTVHYFVQTGHDAMGMPITRVVGSQTFTGRSGATFSGSQLHIPAGYKLAMDGVTYTIGDTDEVNNTPVVPLGTTSYDHHQDNQPSTRPTDHNDHQQSSAAQLPHGAKVVNGHVVDAQGNILPGWKVVNGQAVKDNTAVMTRETYKAQQAKKQLPQTGNDNSLAVMSLGAAGFLGMLGLAGLNKKRG